MTDPTRDMVDLRTVGLPDLLWGLVRARSFYGVLDAFTEACAHGAREIGRDLEAPNLNPEAKAEYERELDFFECAVEHLRLVRATIEDDAEIRDTAPNETIGRRFRADGHW